MAPPKTTPPTPSAADWLTVEQAAQRVGMSAKTIRRWIDAGRLPAYRAGATAVRVRPADVDACLTRIPATRRRYSA